MKKLLEELRQMQEDKQQPKYQLSQFVLADVNEIRKIEFDKALTILTKSDMTSDDIYDALLTIIEAQEEPKVFIDDMEDLNDTGDIYTEFDEVYEGLGMLEKDYHIVKLVQAANQEDIVEVALRLAILVLCLEDEVQEPVKPKKKTASKSKQKVEVAEEVDLDLGDGLVL